MDKSTGNHSMFQALNHRVGHYGLLLAAGFFLFLVNLGGPNLWDVDEGRNATAALEMMESGDYIQPTFNGELRDHKPALLYWLQVIAFHLFGVNEFAARLPSALAALLVMLLTYELGRSLFNVFTGLVAGLVAASTIMLGAAARFANPDSLLNLFSVLALALLWLSYSRSRKVPCLACGVACGLAVLAKGPVGVLLPGTVAVLFLLWVRNLRAYFTPRLLLGVISFSLVALPWYVLVCLETKGSFLFGFFLRHNVDRFLSPMEHHGGGAGYYILVLLVGFAPWSAFLGLTLWTGFWSCLRSPFPMFRRWWTATRDMEFDALGGDSVSGEASAPQKLPGLTTPGSPGKTSPPPPTVDRYRFLFCWLAVYLLFFTLAATKLPNYILPLVTPLAILTGRCLDRCRAGALAQAAWAYGVGLLVFAAIGVLAAAGLVIASGGITIPGLNAPPFAGLDLWSLLGLVPVAGALASWWCWRRQRRSSAVACLTLSAVLFLAPLLSWACDLFDQFKPARGLVDWSSKPVPCNGPMRF
jgi:4-amino-4-deoxy-L-arabinose transferase-like glycosyltransferase